MYTVHTDKSTLQRDSLTLIGPGIWQKIFLVELEKRISQSTQKYKRLPTDSDLANLSQSQL